MEAGSGKSLFSTNSEPKWDHIDSESIQFYDASKRLCGNIAFLLGHTLFTWWVETSLHIQFMLGLCLLATTKNLSKQSKSKINSLIIHHSEHSHK
jgi:hypothetical protein